jgi:hypothetical protein
LPLSKVVPSIHIKKVGTRSETLPRTSKCTLKVSEARATVRDLLRNSAFSTSRKVVERCGRIQLLASLPSRFWIEYIRCDIEGMNSIASSDSRYIGSVPAAAVIPAPSAYINKYCCCAFGSEGTTGYLHFLGAFRVWPRCRKLDCTTATCCCKPCRPLQSGVPWSIY